jgi:MinD-like ATPase involved in chromosome partitioning or flagellar assembly
MCHASEDKELVLTLCGTLRNAGFDPWLDEERVMPGEDWQEKIDAALRSCGAVIVCLSERSVVKDGYVNKEIHRALDLADEKVPGSRFIFPVKFDSVAVPRYLSRWQWAELGKPEALRRLVQSLEQRARELEARGALSGAATAMPSADSAESASRLLSPITIAVMGTKGGVGKGVFVSFAAQLIAAAGNDVAVIDLDLAASGTTLAAEGEYGHTKPTSILTAFDHVARKATNIARYASGRSEELWDITPSFVGAIRGGHVWLLPAREPANPGQSFDVVANVLPPSQREQKLATVVQEQIDRICQWYPKVRAILIDCGAERNPIYGAAFSKADRGYILFGPNPEYFGEVKAVRDELLRMYRSINPSSVYAVANNVMSIADEQRCRAGISPIPLMAAIPSDPTLRIAHSENLATHIDLGHENISKAICEALAPVIDNRRASMIEADHVVSIPVVSLFLNGGGLQELSRKLRIRLIVAASIGILAVVAIVLLVAAFALKGFGDRHVQIGLRNWLLAGMLLSFVLLAVSVWFLRSFWLRRKLLFGFGEISAAVQVDLFSAVLEKMRFVRKRDPRLAKQIQRWIERRQHDERKTR